MKAQEQPEALELLEWFAEANGFSQGTKAPHKWVLRTESELRRQHAEIQQIKGQLTTQTNRAAAAEQQVTALTQRLDMANQLNTDAREQLAKLSARQAAPDGWRLVPVEPTEEMVTAGQESFGVHDCYYAMLSAAPPPPEREQLAVDGTYTITIECGAAQARFVITEMQIETAPSPAEYVGHAVSKAFAAIDKRRVSHGIGATNDNT